METCRMTPETLFIAFGGVWSIGWLFAAWFTLYRKYGWGFWREVYLDYLAWLED